MKLFILRLIPSLSRQAKRPPLGPGKGNKPRRSRDALVPQGIAGARPRPGELPAHSTRPFPLSKSVPREGVTSSHFRPGGQKTASTNPNHATGRSRERVPQSLVAGLPLSVPRASASTLRSWADCFIPAHAESSSETFFNAGHSRLLVCGACGRRHPGIGVRRGPTTTRAGGRRSHHCRVIVPAFLRSSGALPRFPGAIHL